MNKAILKYFVSLVVVCLLSCTLILNLMVSSLWQDMSQRDMLFAIKLVEYELDFEEDLQAQIDAMNPLTYGENTRITVIDIEGNVVADTDEQDLENHSDRDEVIEAIESGEGMSIRYSETLETNLMYVAYFNGEYVCRLSIEYSGIFDNLDLLLIPSLTSLCMALLLAIILARSLAKRLSLPVTEISERVENMNVFEGVSFRQYPFEEYNTVTDAIVRQSKMIKDGVHKLRLEKMKITGILDNMNEGFILLDDNFTILLVNKQAQKIFSKHMKISRSALDYIFEPKILEAFKKVTIEKQVVDIKKDNAIFACYINKVEYGITVLFVDETMARNQLKMRQEFFTNVSHELKTPMTSIRGYSELLQTGIIDQEKMRQTALDKIQNEVSNMEGLINDILTISRLENKDFIEERTTIQLHLVAQEVIASLQVEADKRHIMIKNHCEEIEYICSHQHIHQLFNNLIFNAVKYNVESGQVTVSCFEEGGYVKIKVADTGIGIPLADHQRIFERFYRVDKGRDKATGGTGLGLSIVKHIVQYYNGLIEIDSALNKGTTITICLPIK
ncbi:sensor histidine kinase [Tannockella kyphosi]|uniref:sensor histidine kinase n=1 Tax=Tannockella kyphosi TaxID=2899121 RepID=UPI0020136814|nr:ATP-binding protein [Tannockella kyphosi]